MTEIRVGGYTRVSTSEAADKGTSLESQKAHLDMWVQQNNANLVCHYSDPGFTGKDGDRPGLRQLLNDADAKRFDTVVVTKLDRLARNLRLLLDIEANLREKNVALVSIGENVNTSTAFGRMVFQILGIVGEWERAAIVERTTEGRRRRYARREWGPGNCLFGYQYNPSTRKLEIENGEAEVVRRIFNLYVFDRLGLAQIARQLNREGARTRQRATRWHQSAIRDVVTHPGYKGTHPLGVEIPPIVTPEFWDLAQQRRGDNKRLHRRNGSAWLLQGLMKCGLCGHVLACVYFHGRRVYSCRGRRQDTYPDANHKCSLPNLDAQWLEEQVIKNVLDALNTPQGMEKAIADTIAMLENKKAELEEGIAPIEAWIKAIDEKLAKLIETWFADIIGTEALEQKRQELIEEKARLEALRGQIDPCQIEEYRDVARRLRIYRPELENIRTGGRDGSVPLMELAGVGKPPPQKLTDADVVTMQRQVLDRLQVNLWVYRDRVEINALVPIKDVGIREDNPAYRSDHYRQSQ